MKLSTVALSVCSLASTAAFADACFIVQDHYTPAAYRVVYHGGEGLTYSNYYTTGISVSQIRHSELTAMSPAAFFGPMMLSIRERPHDTRGGHFRALGYQNGTVIELETGRDLNDITIWHKFVTPTGDFHTHIAGDVRPCHSSEWRMAIVGCQAPLQQGAIRQGQEFEDPYQQH